MATLRVVLDLADAVAARELGDREAAEAGLRALRSGACYPSTYVDVLAGLELAEARLGEGDVAAAEALLRDVDATGRHPGRVARTAVLVALARQDLEAAARRA
ncbi:hypothetical protein, partial [Nocardioides sp.]|uniref:hypothetical protein n=1 Tax=Nocardioides sp. TaxID=35761 RepID=UPI0025D59ADA